MKKWKLPSIVESAKNRPLSLDKSSGEFIYYDEIEKGLQKITPIDSLNKEQLLKLVLERQFTNIPGSLVVLNGQQFTREELAQEIQQQSKIGRQIFEADINYLKFYLATFPKECFQH